MHASSLPFAAALAICLRPAELAIVIGTDKNTGKYLFLVVQQTPQAKAILASGADYPSPAEAIDAVSTLLYELIANYGNVIKIALSRRMISCIVTQLQEDGVTTPALLAA